jgi:peptide/nickel transport system substrate-binding protein
MKKITALLLALILMLTLFACQKAETEAPAPAPVETTSQESAEPTPERVLTIGSTNNFSGGLQFNKIVDGGDTYFIYFNTGVYETLVTLDNDYRPIPKLATSWESSADGLEWTFKLKEGVKFHDGEDFNADAVIANVNIFVNNPALDYYKTYANMTKVEAVDAYTVKFTFSVPEPAFECKMFFAGGPIYSPKVINADGTISKPIGTGPLVFESYKKDTEFTFTANTNYHGGTLNFDRVVLKFLLDTNTRVAALQAGEIDAIVDTGGILPDQVIALQNDSNMTVQTQRTNTSHYLLFNYKSGPFTDVRMRQLVNYLIDREGLVNAVVSGYGVPGCESSVWSKDWDTGLYSISYDKQKATELAAELDEYKDDNIRILLCSNFAERWPYKEYAEYIKAALDELGFKTEILMYEYGGTSDALNAMDFDLAISIHSNVSGDAGFFYDTLINSQDWLRQIYNTDVAVDFVTRGAVEMDKAARTAIYKELYQTIIDEVWFIPLYHETAPYVFNNTTVENLKMDANFCANFTELIVK